MASEALMNGTALLVIDMQRGAFDGVRCPSIDRPDELLGNTRSLVAAARHAGVPVVFVQHCAPVGKALEEGTPHWEIHEQLAPWEGELVVRKYASSAFENTNLGAALRARGVTDLVVCGLQSELCVCNTGKAALALGFGLRVAQDGHGTWPSEGKSSRRISEEVNEALRSLGAVMASTAQLAATWRAGAQENTA